MMLRRLLLNHIGIMYSEGSAMDYDVCVDFGQGGEIDITVDVDYEWAVEMVEDGVIERWTDNIDDTELFNLIDEKLSLGKVLAHYAKLDPKALARKAVEILEVDE